MRKDGRAVCLTVAVTVADLRRERVDASLVNVHDELQETQLLFNELLLLKEEAEGWVLVETVEQRKSNNESHAGWVRKKCVERIEKPPEHNGIVQSAFTVVTATPSPRAIPIVPLSLGTRVLLTDAASEGFSEVVLSGHETGWVPGKDLTGREKGAARRRATGKEVVEAAGLFLGVPYLWGGRSMPVPGIGTPMGVDCSGLVNLAFRVCGIDVPRDAHEQWLSASPLDAGSVGPGDLIFVSGENEEGFVNHVMLSLGGERFIEAPNTGDVVRTGTFAEKFGLDLERLRRHGFVTNGRKIYFGRVEKE